MESIIYKEIHATSELPNTEDVFYFIYWDNEPTVARYERRKGKPVFIIYDEDEYILSEMKRIRWLKRVRQL